MAVVVVPVGAGDEDGPPGPDGVIVDLLLPRRAALRREPNGLLQERGPRVRREAGAEQQREGKESEGRHGMAFGSDFGFRGDEEGNGAEEEERGV